MDNKYKNTNTISVPNERYSGFEGIAQLFLEQKKLMDALEAENRELRYRATGSRPHYERSASAGFEGLAQLLFEQKKLMDALEAENRELRRTTGMQSLAIIDTLPHRMETSGAGFEGIAQLLLERKKLMDALEAENRELSGRAPGSRPHYERSASAGFEGIAQLLLEQKKLMDALATENLELRRTTGMQSSPSRSTPSSLLGSQNIGRHSHKEASSPAAELTIKIFYCYAQEDEALRDQLARHLSPFRRLRYITGWFNRDIQAGKDWAKENEKHLDAANIILLLLSADFFASDHHYTVEMERAISRHKAGTAHVIPILLRPVAWKETPIGELSALPANGKSVTQWANQDEAWLNVVQGIREVIRDLVQKQPLSLEENDVLYPEQGPLSGQVIGKKYLLGELLGEGGFSEVYKAQHIEMQRQQAIKVLHERHFRKPEFRDRFLREARTIASLDHHHIIHLDDFWTEASQAYLVMPFISGGTLQGILDKQQGFLEHDRVVFYFECICAAIDYAHKKEIAHLDLKPLNLLVHENGELLLSDFGLAHLMKQGRIAGGSSLRAGTPHYMAPEHINGFPEKRSDLFSLGVILYQILVGRLPFDGLPEETILLKNMMEWPPAPRSHRPELPQSVENMLEKALAKRPEQRYQTANEFLMALKNALTHGIKWPKGR